MALNIQIPELSDGYNHELKINNVNVGSVGVVSNQMIWSVGIQDPAAVKFSIRDTERLGRILNILNDKAKEIGLAGAIIRNCPGDIGTFFTEEEWESIGYERGEGNSYYREKKEI